MPKQPDRDWKHMPDRIEALRDFVDALNADEQLRQDCINKPATARKEFITRGRFAKKKPADPNGPHPVPAHVKFRIYEREGESLESKRNGLVTIVLPESNKYEETDVWACTYIVYKVKAGQKNKGATQPGSKPASKARRTSAKKRTR